MNARLDRLLSSLEPLGAGAMLLHSPSNLRYYTGFTGEGCAFISRGASVVLTDSRYTEQARSQAPGFAVLELAMDKYAQTAEGLARDHGATAVGFEDEWLPVAQHRKLAEALAGVSLVPVGGLCVKLRSVKDAGEIALIRQACQLTDEAFQYALTVAKPGITEMDLVTELRYYMAKHQKAQPAFDFIAASGENGSMPHAIASERVMKRGDMVTLDFGAEYKGYKADMTRTFALGEPTDTLKQIHAVVLQAQRMAADALGPDVACSAADAVARAHIADHGYGSNFGHGLGHGVGLDIHELPGLSARSQTVLEPGMVVTVEPGIYLPGIGGVRIEDTCLVTESGWESLFRSDKSLIIL